MGQSLLGAVLRGLWTTAARADTALDVQILQTASSVEALAVAAYDMALGRLAEPDALASFARETRRQHEEHKKAFQAQTVALDPRARIQDAPNPKFLPALAGADLSTPEKLVEFAAQLEKVATDTYLLNLTLLHDPGAKSLMGSVMGAEAQHLAYLRLAPAYPAPADIMKLPPAAGSVAFQGALHQVGGADQIAEPGSGAVR